MTDGWGDSKKKDGQADGRRRDRYAGLAGPALHILAEGGVQKVKRENLINVIRASPRRRAEIKLNEIPVCSAERARKCPLSAGGVVTRRGRLSLTPPHRCSRR